MPTIPRAQFDSSDNVPAGELVILPGGSYAITIKARADVVAPNVFAVFNTENNAAIALFEHFAQPIEVVRLGTDYVAELSEMQTTTFGHAAEFAAARSSMLVTPIGVGFLIRMPDRPNYFRFVSLSDYVTQQIPDHGAVLGKWRLGLRKSEGMRWLVENIGL